jgi:hypothetical protein
MVGLGTVCRNDPNWVGKPKLTSPGGVLLAFEPDASTGVEAGNDATFAGATAPTPAGDRGIFVLALSVLGPRPKATEDPADGCVFGT